MNNVNVNDKTPHPFHQIGKTILKKYNYHHISSHSFLLSQNPEPGMPKKYGGLEREMTSTWWLSETFTWNEWEKFLSNQYKTLYKVDNSLHTDTWERVSLTKVMKYSPTCPKGHLSLWEWLWTPLYFFNSLPLSIATPCQTWFQHQ